MRIRYAAKTDVGMKRNHNEDYFSLIEDEQLFLVADGMGGHASGEVASKMAAEVLQEFYVRTKDDEATWPYKMDRQLSYVENRLVVGIKMANQRIFHAACRDIKFKGMGTTIVSGQVVGDKFYIAHVGDSRCSRTTRTPSPTCPRTSSGSFRTRTSSRGRWACARPCRSTSWRTTFKIRTSSYCAPTVCRAWSRTRKSWSW